MSKVSKLEEEFADLMHEKEKDEENIKMLGKEKNLLVYQSSTLEKKLEEATKEIEFLKQVFCDFKTLNNR